MANSKISALTSATTPLAGTEVLPIVQSGATVKVANNDLRPKQIQSNATSGVLQVTGPGANTTRVMTVPNANFTAARTDAAQTFSGAQRVDGLLSLNTGSSGLQTARSMSFLTTGGCTQYISHSTSDGNGDTFLEFGYNGNLIGSIVQYGTTSVNFKPAAGGGIDFSANTHAAGMTSELLNWYEEGTWTPTLKGDGTAGTYQTAVAYGHYTRVGRLVTLHCAITLAAVVTGGGTGDIIITGLPYAKAANTSSSPGSADGVFTSVPMFVSFSTRGSSSTLYVFDTTRALIPVSQATANKNIDFVVTYIV